MIWSCLFLITINTANNWIDNVVLISPLQWEGTKQALRKSEEIIKHVCYSRWLNKGKSGKNKRADRRLELNRYKIYHLFFERTVYKCFILLKILQKETKRKIHPQWFLISKIYQWVYGYTKRENTHTISKYVQVCMWAEISKFFIYTKTICHCDCGAQWVAAAAGDVRSTWEYTVQKVWQKVFNGVSSCRWAHATV